MDRWRDGHVLGEAQRLMVALADLLIRHTPVKFENKSSETRMIAGPRRDRRNRRNRIDRRGERGRIRRIRRSGRRP
jgi:hypothetical protein